MQANDRRRVLVSKRIFDVSNELLEELAEVRRSWGDDDITGEYDAFLLDGGLGPATYLTRDGRIIWDDDIWDVKCTLRDALVGIAAGIKKTRVERLRALLPERPHDARLCDECLSTGRFDAHGTLQSIDGRAFSIVCPTCAGLGWISSSVDLDRSVLDPA